MSRFSLGVESIAEDHFTIMESDNPDCDKVAVFDHHSNKVAIVAPGITFDYQHGNNKGNGFTMPGVSRFEKEEDRLVKFVHPLYEALLSHRLPESTPPAA